MPVNGTNRKESVARVNVLGAAWLFAMAAGLLGLASSAEAAIAVDSTNGSTGGGSFLSFSHTVGAGPNRLLVVSVAVDASLPNSDVITMTYNGVSMTQAIEHWAPPSGAVTSTEIWYMLDSDLPLPGSYTIAITTSGNTSEIRAGSVSVFGAAQQGPEATAFADDDTAATAISQTISTLTNGAWIFDCVASDGTTTFTPDPGQNEFFDAGISHGAAGSYEEKTRAGSENQGWTVDFSSSQMSYVLAAFAPAQVYYSVGVSWPGNLAILPANIQITNGLATLDQAQTGNIGVGDEIEYGGGTTAYIQTVISSTQFVLQTATGAKPPDTAFVGVSGIRRAFGTIANAIANSGDGLHLNNFDLTPTGADVNLTWICYDDGAFDAPASINGYTTDPTHYITLTVAGASQVASGASQRHLGTAGTGARLVAVGGGGPMIDVGNDFVTVEWLEIDGTGFDRGYGIRAAGPLLDITFRNLIVHDIARSASPVRGIGINQVDQAFVYNNLVYDILSTDPGASGRAHGITDELAGSYNTFIHNNTVFNIRNVQAAATANVYGIVGPDSADRTVVNNIVIDVYTLGVGNAQAYCAYNTGALNVGTEVCQTGATPPVNATYQHNMSSDDTAVDNPPGATSITFENGGEFQNTLNGSEDLHLAIGANAIDAGFDASGLFGHDIDGEFRIAPWDMGADEALVTAAPLYRSVGINSADLNTSFRTVEIVGGTATFSGPMPNDVGVGDVLQYNDGSFHLAFIHGRSSATVYTVRDASGGIPQPAGPGTFVEVFRAYTFLSDWGTQFENTSLDISVRDFDTSNDLVASDTIMNVACYGDGPDTKNVFLSGWITAPSNYIRIYTPTDPSEVGASQRHNGTWNLNAYRLEIDGITALEVQDNYVRIDGLQVWMRTDTNGALGIAFRSSIGASDYEVSNSIVRGNGSGIEDIRIGLEIFSAGSGVLKAHNNLFYDWDGSGLTFVVGISPDDPDFTVYLYNNTVVDGQDGINVFQGTVIAKNNLVYNNVDNYVGTFDIGASTNNLSGPGPDLDIPPNSARDGVGVTFVNAAADDFHLDPSDTGAQSFGTKLSADPDLAFADDIDAESRVTPWDIGADEIIPAAVGDLTQNHYRWRNDDAGESAATWALPQDTKLIGLAEQSPRRLRFDVSNEGVLNAGPVAFQLQVAETAACAAGTYTAVPIDASGDWQIIDSVFITDGEATTNVTPGLTDEASVFISGEVRDANNAASSMTLNGDEIEFSIQATSNATRGGDYCFRLFDALGGSVLGTYLEFAEVSVSDADLALSDHDVGQVSDQFSTSPSVITELFRFKLSAAGTGPVTVDDIKVHFTITGGVVNGDVTSGELWRDNNNDGVIDGADTQLQIGVTPSGGVLDFSGLGESPGAGTNYLVLATVSSLVAGDATTFSLDLDGIDLVESGVAESGTASSVVHTQDSAAGGDVYYSVGTSRASLIDLKSGPTDITIVNGTATFTTDQSGGIGVGDEINYVGGPLVYISGRINASTYTVTTATGLAPPNINAAMVNSIMRAFPSLNDAALFSGDPAHLATADLVSNGFRLHWACYNEAPDTTPVRIEEPWVTGPNNYIRVFTPTELNQVGVSQRHIGIAGTGYRIAPSVAAGPGFYNFILVSNDTGYVYIEGIEIDGINVSFGENVRGIFVDDGGSAMEDVRISHSLIYDISNGTADELDQSDTWGIEVGDANDTKIWNNFVYNITNLSANAASDAIGIEATTAGNSHYIYNNTVFRVLNAGSAGFALGIADTAGGTMWVRNNYVGLADSPSGAEACFSGAFAAQNNNVSSDGTAAGVGSQVNQSNYADYFFDAVFGTENLHLLASSNALWGSPGADLDGDLNLPVTDDIDDELRDPSTPDIGADEALNVNYRSIGIAPDYTNGSIDAFAGSAVVTGSTTLWQSANRGRGDRIDINGTDYTILRVDSETQLTLTEPVAGNHSGIYEISRQFTTLQAWEDCISGNGGCIYFPVVSGDLVLEHRKEIGIAYNDSAVPSDPDFVRGVTFEDSITDPLHDITLTANPRNRHYGQAGGGVLLDSLTASDTEDEIRIRNDNVTVEWLEIRNVRGASTDAGVKVFSATNVLLRLLLVHDNSNGIRLSGNTGDRVVTVRNSIIYNNDELGIEGDNLSDLLSVENVTVFGNVQGGIDAQLSTAIVRNTISMNAVPGQDFQFGGGLLVDNNISADGTASCGSCFPFRDATDLTSPGAPPQLNGWVMFVDLTPGAEDFHLQDNPAINNAQNNALNLSGTFVADIDGGARTPAWDIGADDIAATTAVELLSFEAQGGDGAIELRWETGSEVDNVGFYLYRATSESGPYQPVNPNVIPGLGSSPLGASYRYVDSGLVNGQSYFYELEDLESTGVRERHGPVSATPLAGATFDSPAEDGEEEDESVSSEHGITYGNPEQTILRVLKRSRRQVTLELITGGFYAEPQDDGSVRLSIPGFLEDWEPGTPAIPVKRTWLQAVVGKQVKIKSVKAKSVEAFSLRPTSAELLEPVMLPDGTVSLASSAQQPGKAFRGQGLYPESPVHIVSIAFQGDVKKAFLELSPLRWDRSTGQLLLARRLIVKVKFKGKVPGEKSLGGSRGRKRRKKNAGSGNVVANLVTHDSGLYGVSYQSLFGSRRKSIKTKTLNLTYQGEPVSFYVHPNKKQFKRGSRLYFLSGGEELNPYGREAVYVLSASGGGQKMERGSASPSGLQVGHYWKTLKLEENHLFQGRLTTAPDVWLWDFLLAPVTKAYSFEVQDLAPTSESGSLKVWIQGTTDLPTDPDHHVRIYLNGMLLDDFTLEGELPWMSDLSLLPGALLEGENTLEIENVGDTGAAYSRIMLNRFEVTYPSQLVADSGQLRGSFGESGVAEVTGLTGSSLLLDTTGPVTKWLSGAQPFEGGLRFRAESQHHYLVADSTAVMSPEIRRPFPYRLKSMLYGANYVVIGPENLLEASWPLLELRLSQGLTVLAVPIEQIYSEFGHGETRTRRHQELLGACLSQLENSSSLRLAPR